MELEDKAKVVASVWGAEFVQFLAALARSLFVSVDLEETVESSFSFKSTEAKQLSRQGIKHILAPQTDASNFALSSNSILLL